MKLIDWSARRAGGRITVNGTNEHGQKTKIVGVDTIEPSPGDRLSVHATDRNGDVHELIV